MKYLAFSKYLFILFFIVGCSNPDPEHIKAANKIRSKYNKYLKANKIQIFGIGGAMFQCINEFYYELVLYDSPDIERARKHLIENLEVFLSVVNNDENARPYLKEFPYSENSVHFSIGFWKDHLVDVQPPYIARASVYNGKVSYSTDAGWKYENVYRETYAEAYEKVYGVPLCR